MNKTRLFLLLVSIAISVSIFSQIFTLPVYGYSTLPWATFMHDYSHTGLSQFTGTQSNLTLWKFNVKNGTSSLVIGQNDTIYFGSWGSLFALNKDHTEKFKITVGGIVDPPSIGSDGTLYFENGGSVIFAADPDGIINWKYPSNATVTIPVIDLKDRIYFGSGNLLESVSSDGNLLWKYRTDGLVSIPSVGPDGAIYFGDTDHNFYSIDSSGNLKWKFNAKGSTTLASINPQGTIYFCDSDNYLYSLKPNGTLNWTYQSTNSGSPPAIGYDNTLYLLDDTGLVALNSNGIKKWDFHPTNVTIQSVSIDKDGTIYAGIYENRLYALDPSGNVKWNYKSYGSVGQAVIGSDGTTYFNSGEGVIYALGQPIPEFPFAILTLIIATFSIILFQKVILLIK